MNVMLLKELFEKLYKPFVDSVVGKLSWKEILSAVVLTLVFLFTGGQVSELISMLFNLNQFTADQIINGLILLIVSLLHKKEQGN